MSNDLSLTWNEEIDLCMRRIGPGPYFAVAVRPADLASSAGLHTDQNARVLDLNQRPIDGLYAVAADAASIFRGTYPGPGTMIGPAIVFGWRAAMHARKMQKSLVEAC